MYSIRDLLDFLEAVDRKAIDHLCSVRGVERWKRVERLEFLARSYGGDHELFFSDLSKRDLYELLTDPTELDDESYYLPSAGSYSKPELVRIALECFRDDMVADELVSLGPVGDDEDEDEDAAQGPMPDDVFLFDPVAAASLAHGYQKELIAALATAVARARSGKRLRITVATGGGKTRIANDWIWNHALPKKHRVLWVTKDWALLRQAASDLCRRQRGGVKRLADCAGATRLDAYTFVAKTPCSAGCGPSEPYRAIVVDGARMRGLPDAYIATLES